MHNRQKMGSLWSDTAPEIEDTKRFLFTNYYPKTKLRRHVRTPFKHVSGRWPSFEALQKTHRL